VSTLVTNTIKNLEDKTILRSSGSVLQVVQTVVSNTVSVTSNTVAQDVTGMSASITPTSATSKILIQAMISYGSTGTTYGGFFTRNGVAIGLGDTGSNRQRVSMGLAFPSDGNQMNSFVYTYLDNPLTLSPLVYQFRVINDNANAFHLNRSSTDSDNNTGKRGISTVTLMEIAA
jgi:hypothetical protein